MRTIKFRCYLKDSALDGLNKRHFERPEIGRVFEVDVIDFESEMVTIYCPSELEFSFNDIDLLQSTGLFDKNGVEIFEGDIFEAPHDFGPAGFVKTRASVEFDIENGYQWGYWDLSKLEVIGNVHQNPELLSK